MALNISLQSEADIYCHLETGVKLITNNSQMVFKPLLYKQQEEIQADRDMKKSLQNHTRYMDEKANSYCLSVGVDLC